MLVFLYGGSIQVKAEGGIFLEMLLRHFRSLLDFFSVTG